MGAHEELAQILDVHARVERGRTQSLVPEQLLDVADARPAMEQVRRVAVAQGGKTVRPLGRR
jgi:hypothetical protein